MYIFISYTIIQKSVHFFFYKKLIQQGCIKLIKSDSKDIKNVTKVSISNKCCCFELSIHQRIKRLDYGFHKNMKQHNGFQHGW